MQSQVPLFEPLPRTSSVWLSDEEMMNLYSTQSVIWAILIDAKTSLSSTETTVNISGYGTAG